MSPAACSSSHASTRRSRFLLTSTPRCPTIQSGYSSIYSSNYPSLWAGATSTCVERSRPEVPLGQIRRDRTRRCRPPIATQSPHLGSRCGERNIPFRKHPSTFDRQPRVNWAAEHSSGPVLQVRRTVQLLTAARGPAGPALSDRSATQSLRQISTDWQSSGCFKHAWHVPHANIHGLSRVCLSIVGIRPQLFWRRRRKILKTKPLPEVGRPQ